MVAGERLDDLPSLGAATLGSPLRWGRIMPCEHSANKRSLLTLGRGAGKMAFHTSNGLHIVWT